MDISKIEMNEDIFLSMHKADRMTNEKLAEGISKFADAQISSEGLLKERLG